MEDRNAIKQREREALRYEDSSRDQWSKSSARCYQIIKVGNLLHYKGGWPLSIWLPVNLYAQFLIFQGCSHIANRLQSGSVKQHRVILDLSHFHHSGVLELVVQHALWTEVAYVS